MQVYKMGLYTMEHYSEGFSTNPPVILHMNYSQNMFCYEKWCVVRRVFFLFFYSFELKSEMHFSQFNGLFSLANHFFISNLDDKNEENCRWGGVK